MYMDALTEMRGRAPLFRVDRAALSGCDIEGCGPVLPVFLNGIALRRCGLSASFSCLLKLGWDRTN